MPMISRAAPTRGGLARGILMGLALLPLLAAAAHAAPGDPDAGHALAKRWCAICHHIEPGAVSSGVPPSFAALATRHAKDPDWVRAWLSNPQHPVRGIGLSERQIADIVAYLQSLPH
jgi:mono/diheme cytochrome c family protein